MSWPNGDQRDRLITFKYVLLCRNIADALSKPLTAVVLCDHASVCGLFSAALGKSVLQREQIRKFCRQDVVDYE